MVTVIDKGAETWQDWIVEGEETRIKSRMDDEMGVMHVGSETICDRQKLVQI